MMENMILQEGDILHIKNASLSKGTYVKLQPHTKDFIDLANPKAMLVDCFGAYLSLTSNLVDCFTWGNLIGFSLFAAWRQPLGTILV